MEQPTGASSIIPVILNVCFLGTMPRRRPRSIGLISQTLSQDVQDGYGDVVHPTRLAWFYNVICGKRRVGYDIQFISVPMGLRHCDGRISASQAHSMSLRHLLMTVDLWPGCDGHSTEATLIRSCWPIQCEASVSAASARVSDFH
jgi:hypothetical protein